MVTTSILFLMLLLQPVWVSQPSEEPQSLQRRLQVNLEQYTLSADTFLQALTKVATQFEIPMGIEWVQAPVSLRNVNLSWQRVTVYQVVKSLVESQPGYEVEISNGVVHVFPRGSPRDPHNFLNLRIDKFKVQNEPVAVANHRLHALVKRIVSSPPPSPPGAGEAGSIATSTDDRQVSLELENATVRDILDKLILAGVFKIWIVTYPESPALTKAGFRQVLSLYRSSVPGEEAPVWALLRWGVEPPGKESW